jgi:predicted nucleic acid-binding protein
MIALDTDVLIYACDRADARRQQIAINLVANSTDGVLQWRIAMAIRAEKRT